jgi:hypothetical protein
LFLDKPFVLHRSQSKDFEAELHLFFSCEPFFATFYKKKCLRQNWTCVSRRRRCSEGKIPGGHSTRPLRNPQGCNK